MRRLAVVALLALSACATPEPPRHHGGPGGRGGPPGGPEGGPPRPRLFISPAGEPFRPNGGADPMRTWFDQADTNHDGFLSKDEFVADHMRFFALLDVNGDGRIDGMETTRYEHEVAPEILSAVDRGEGGRIGGRGTGGGGMGRGGGGGGGRHGGGGGRGGGGGGGPPGGGGGGGGFVGDMRTGAAQYSLINEPEPIRAADTDLDSFISIKEWQAAAAIRFADLDLNKDGRIGFDELHMRGPGGGGRGPGKR